MALSSHPQRRQHQPLTSLAQHLRNLIRLQAKKAVDALGEKSLSLLKQLEYEDQEIAPIQSILQNI